MTKFFMGALRCHSLLQGDLVLDGPEVDAEGNALHLDERTKSVWASPGLVDTDQGSAWVSVRAAINCCSSSIGLR